MKTINQDQRPWHKKVFAAGEKKRIEKLARRATKISALADEYAKKTDEELLKTKEELSARYRAGETLDQLLNECFAAVREVATRNVEMRHFDVQLMGGIALHEGCIAEMKTGEGKTLVATLPLCLNALTGNNVQLVTSNDYLAKRDAIWMRNVYEALGFTAEYLQNMQPADEKIAAYKADITYGTASEFGFDYLRDNMARNVSERVQTGHHYVIVDEVDSILIDEARTPLIISGQADESTTVYQQFASIVAKMKEGEHYEFDEKMFTAHPTEAGVAYVEGAIGVENLYTLENTQLVNNLIQAIKAKSLYSLDKEYVIAPGEDGEPEIKIVDENTGRTMEGRRWSDGLHQAIEAKENVPIQEENITIATVTIQNYFRMYEKLSGMTGTASTEVVEGNFRNFSIHKKRLKPVGLCEETIFSR